MDEMEQHYAALIEQAIRTGMETSPRTQQSRAGLIGPSDIGFCRNKAALVVKEVQPTDETDPWAAAVGIALHNYVEDNLNKADFGWLVEKKKVTATLPRSGAQISGTPDIIDPERNAILDLKSVDGLKKIEYYGTTKAHQYQRHLYAMGAVDAGLLDGSRQVYVGNAYVDVSRGQGQKVLVKLQPFDDSLTDEIDSWVEDVIYAVKQGEDAERDLPAAVCEKICEFYTVCRGGLPSQESEPFTDPEVVNSIDLYVKGRDLEKEGKQMKKEAAAILTGLNGSDGTWQVRTVVVGEQDVPGFHRNASVRLDVRRARKP